MPHFRIQIRERHKLLILFFLGALGSACFIRYAGIGMEEEICAKGRMIFAGLAADLAEGDGLFWRCMARRGLLPIVWTGLSFTVFGLASLYLFWIYLGFSMTTALWVAMVFGGWRGPFYFWGLLFPQYLLYAPALLLIYASCLQWNRFWRIRRAPTAPGKKPAAAALPGAQFAGTAADSGRGLCGKPMESLASQENFHQNVRIS